MSTEDSANLRKLLLDIGCPPEAIPGLCRMYGISHVIILPGSVESLIIPHIDDGNSGIGCDFIPMFTT